MEKVDGFNTIARLEFETNAYFLLAVYFDCDAEWRQYNLIETNKSYFIFDFIESLPWL